MGLLDSNKVIVTSKITDGSANLDLSTGGHKLTINTNGKNTLCIKFTMTGGNAVILVNSFTTYGKALPLYDFSGNIYKSLKKSGNYYVDVTGITSINLYCMPAVAGATATVDYYLANDAPVSITALKPIQLLSEYDITTNADTTEYSIFQINLPSFFKYFFICGIYELNGVGRFCSIAISMGDAIEYVVDGNKIIRTMDSEVFRVMEAKSFKSGFIENQQMLSGTNGRIDFQSTPVEGAILHLRIFGVR